MFQNEVRQALGEDVVRQTGGGRNQPAGATRKTETNADKGGIMKSLASMGTATKQNLLELAQRFSRTQNNSTSATNRANSQLYRNGEYGTAREFKPLVDSNDDDEVSKVNGIF